MIKGNKNINVEKLWSYWFFISFFIVALILSPCAVQSSVLQSLDVNYVQGLNKKKCTLHQLDKKEDNFRSSSNPLFAWVDVIYPKYSVHTYYLQQQIKLANQWMVTLKRFILYRQLKVANINVSTFS